MVTRDPLRYRFLREILADKGRYLMLFLLIILAIGEVSGYFVALGSMKAAYDESFSKYDIEWGHFIAEKELNNTRREKIQEANIKIFDIFYKELDMDNGSVLRLYRNRKEVNRICLMEGRFPEQSDEIAIDRCYAKNNSINTGDRLTAEGREFTVCGLVSFSDYSSMFGDNSDSMFDATGFGTAVVSDGTFEGLKGPSAYSYAFLYDDPPKDDMEEKEMSEELSSRLSSMMKIDDFVPRYLNQAIRFTGEDMDGDNGAMHVFLMIAMTVIAFIFAVNISNTIVAESTVIGTLRASGFSRWELLIHYMTLPVMITVISCIIGNILGYTVLKDINAGLYYNSYSLPTYETRWNTEAFMKTTVLTLVLMFVINMTVIWRKLKLSPIRFLRKDISARRQKHALHLSPKLTFINRFSLRVIIQNMPNYLVLFVGIFFSCALFMFALMMPQVLVSYKENIDDNLFARYQYILKAPSTGFQSEDKLDNLVELMKFQKAVETDNEDAEKFSAYYLKIPELKGNKGEEVLLYGISRNSEYIKLDMKDDDIYISSAYADKYSIDIGDTVTLREKYGYETYDLKITGIYHYDGALALFMGREKLNSMFDLGKEFFAGYLSDSQITDIDDRYISTVIDTVSLTKISRQLDISFGSMMEVVKYFSVLIAVILIYILSKSVIEKNSHSIAMVKILGYFDSEVGKLYVIPTTIAVVASLAASLPLSDLAIAFLWRKFIVARMTGWIPYDVERTGIYVTIAVSVLAAYMVVAVLELIKIKKISKDEALKNVE